MEGSEVRNRFFYKHRKTIHVDCLADCPEAGFCQDFFIMNVPIPQVTMVEAEYLCELERHRLRQRLFHLLGTLETHMGSDIDATGKRLIERMRELFLPASIL